MNSSGDIQAHSPSFCGSTVGARVPLKGGYEFDVFSPSRRVIASLEIAGVKKLIRRGYNKRFRKAGKMRAVDWAVGDED